jgi:signal transduction histidine kinase
MTMLRALVVARWLSWAWMVGVVFVSQRRDAVEQPAAAWISVASVAGMAAWSTWNLRNDPARSLSRPFIACEVILAIGLSILDGWVFEPGHVFETSQSLATVYPLIAVAAIGLAAGPYVAALVGVLIGPAEWIAAELNGFGEFTLRHYVSIIATSLFYGLAGGVFGWQAQLLRRAEREIADQRARDEVARVLHDTVLQTLALVETRTADSDPELARTAREADRDLRRFLFGASAHTADDLDGRIRAAVERASNGHDVSVTINVIDLGCRAAARQQDAIAWAAAEAVTNSIKHAGCDEIVVFAETDDDGHIFASVRDDGRGFDPKLVTRGAGLRNSIEARMADAGGRSEIVSTPGSGTEVRLWTR